MVPESNKIINKEKKHDSKNILSQKVCKKGGGLHVSPLLDVPWGASKILFLVLTSKILKLLENDRT
jgi:hypothetical protein